MRRAEFISSYKTKRQKDKKTERRRRKMTIKKTIALTKTKTLTNQDYLEINDRHSEPTLKSDTKQYLKFSQCLYIIGTHTHLQIAG